jgi:hypothetical protein
MKLENELNYEGITKEELAEAIRAVYKGYSNMVMGMTKSQQNDFDKALKKLINNKEIF